jgi:adenosine deaminase
MNLAPDISRQIRPIEHSMLVAEWAVKHKDDGIIALGLGGAEIGNPPELFQEAFDYAYTAGLAGAPHAGETEGPASIWGALNTLHAIRIGHGVRCLEDSDLVAYLKQHQIPLQVCPSSNVCLGVVPSLAEHPLPKLLEEGLFVTINSDDPPMFNTTLTDEYLRIHQTMGFDLPLIEGLVLNGVRAALLPFDVRQTMESEFKTKFIQLREELDI